MTVTTVSALDPGAARQGPRWARAAPALAAGAGLAWVGAAGVLERRPSVTESVPIGCPFAMLTGLDCPGCGSTRSLGALTRLDLLAAFDHNLLVPVALVFVVASWVLWARATWGHRAHGVSSDSVTTATGTAGAAAATDIVRRAGVTISIAVVVLVFTVVRNLDVGAWLASTG